MEGAGRTAAEAVNDFLEPLNRVISCITDAVLDVGGGYFASAAPHVMFLADGEPVRLPGSRLALRIIHQYGVAEASGVRATWNVSTSGYSYRLQDLQGHELFAYHWHPSESKPVKTPHLHLGAASGVDPSLSAAHFPTGRIAIADLVSLLIRDLGVRPRRSDWPDILGRAP